MPSVREIHAALQALAPDVIAESWDNVGVLVGALDDEVQRIMLALDPSADLVRQAAEADCQLIITHHPAIFRPIRRLLWDVPEGAFLAAATRNSISVIACHTSLDSAVGGVSQAMAQALGLTGICPLAPASADGNCGLGAGLGAIGEYAVPVAVGDFVRRLREYTQAPWLLQAGTAPETIHRVAMCGGSGSDMAEMALNRGAELFITAEIKHNVARWAEEAGLWLIDAGHFATENPAMPVFAENLRQLFLQRGWQIAVKLARQEPPLQVLH